MVRRSFAGPDRGIFDQNVVLTGHFLDAIKQGGGFRRILEHGLMLPDPFFPFCPGVALLHVERLRGHRSLVRRKVPLRSAKRAEDPAQHPKID